MINNTVAILVGIREADFSALSLFLESGVTRKVIEAALFQSQLKLRPYHAIRTEAA
jgi:hypothetical protein